MSSPRVDVLLWAQRIVAKQNAPAHQLLEIKADATLDTAQQAFHKVARIAHPDLHRTTLTAEDLELVTTAYSRVAGAYQEFRSQRSSPTRPRPGNEAPLVTGRRPGLETPTTGTPTAAPAAPAAAGPAGEMNSKALIYYRKAELALRRGDLRSAVLQMKMAIAGDPQSKFLRTALTEIEAEMAKQ